ncbi:MAG: hypothetical protein ACJ8DU_02020 [Microvirga sp.]
MTAMTDPCLFLNADIMEHNSYHIRLSPSDLDWMAVVPQPQQRPTLIMVLDRNAALAKAYEWIDRQPCI